MSKGLPRSLVRATPIAAVIQKIRVPIDHTVTVDGATGVGFGTVVVAGLPEGNILFLGAVSYATVTKAAGATGITATFDGDYSIGTTATADATITGTDANVIASTALGAATAGVSPTARGANATSAVFDNTDGSLELNLNLLIDDAAISANDQDVVVTGSILLSYVVLGDD